MGDAPCPIGEFRHGHRPAGQRGEHVQMHGGVDGAAFPIHSGSVEQGGRGPVFHNAPPVFLWSSIPRTLPQPPRFDESGSLNRNGPVPAGKRRCPVRGVAGLSCGGTPLPLVDWGVLRLCADRSATLFSRLPIPADRAARAAIVREVCP